MPNVTNETIAMIISIIAMVFVVLSFQVKNKVPLFLVQIVGMLLFMVSYFFNASGIGVIINAINLTRNVIYIFVKENNRKLERVTGICLMVAYVASYVVYTAVAGLSLADNLWNALPVIGALFGTIGTLFASKSVNLYRAWKYGDSVCWLSFNINIGLGAIGGVICEILTLISLTVGILRFREKKTTTQE